MLTFVLIYFLIGIYFGVRQYKIRMVGSLGPLVTYSFAVIVWPFHAFSSWLKWNVER